MIEPKREPDTQDLRLMELVKSGIFDQFTRPLPSIDERRTIDQFAKSTIDRFHRAFVLGRFQPLHRGHIHLMNHALAISSGIIIGIGSANIRNRDNPFSAEHREHMLRRALEKEGIGTRVYKIARINDYEDDTMWLEETLRRAGSNIDVVIGNNDWVNGIFEQAGYKTLAIPLFERDLLSGTTIRERYLYPQRILPETL